MFGITKLATTVKAITAVEKRIALSGTWCRESLLIFLAKRPFSLYVKEKTIRPVLKIELLHAEAAAVKTTKLIIPAAAGIPIFSKT